MAVVISEYAKAPVEVQPEIKDYFPMLFYSNDEVVEIKMVQATFRRGAWELAERGTILENPGKTVTRVVFEGPEGCWETHVRVPAKGTMTIRDDVGGAQWYPCN